MMDLEERSAEHPAQNETLIARKLIARYAQYGLIPLVIPPTAIDPPLPIERIPVQQGTDLDYLSKLAEPARLRLLRHAGPVPFTNTAYWGPPIRVGLPQRAITVNMGAGDQRQARRAPETRSAPTMVEGQVQDRHDEPARSRCGRSAACGRRSRRMPAWLVNQPNVRTTQLREAGLNASQATAQAQGTIEATTDAVERRRRARRRPLRRRAPGARARRRARRRLQLRRLLLRQARDATRSAGALHAEVQLAREGLRLDDAGGAAMSRVLRQVPRQGREQHRPAPAWAASRSACRPCSATAGSAGRCRACRTPGRRSASSRCRRSARTSGSSSRAATPTTRSGAAASGERARCRRRRRCRR